MHLTESIDTSTPGGKLVFHLFGALAEFERDLIREGTLAPLAAARARGRSGGRPTGWTREKQRTARAMGRQPSLARATDQIRWSQITYVTLSSL